jgi:hypothetical protein
MNTPIEKLLVNVFASSVAVRENTSMVAPNGTRQRLVIISVSSGRETESSATRFVWAPLPVKIENVEHGGGRSGRSEWTHLEGPTCEVQSILFHDVTELYHLDNLTF